MTLLRSFSGGEPQTSEDRIGAGLLGLPIDPGLHSGEAFGSLMDIIAVGDIGEGLEQLLKAVALAQNRCSGRPFVARRAARRPHGCKNFFDVLHPCAFPHGIRALIQNLPLAG